MSPNTEDAKDLLQDTFVRVIGARSNVPEGRSNEEAWLVRIMVNICRTRWRQTETRRRLDALHLQPTRAPHPESALVARSTVSRALSILAPRRRAVMVMCELEGMTFASIAGQLGISSVTVRWHLSRGRRELLRFLSHVEGERQ
jgi:RNA polymerase sigma-70 factor (ECF subfamily)